MFKNRDKVFYYDFNEFKNFEKKIDQSIRERCKHTQNCNKNRYHVST